MSLMSIDNLNVVDYRTKVLYFIFLGEVKYIGEVHFKPGMWVGIQYDEPFGKNDGSVEGKRYFQCQPKYGGFVRVTNVTVRDFPEEGFSNCNIGYSNESSIFWLTFKITLSFYRSIIFAIRLIILNANPHSRFKMNLTLICIVDHRTKLYFIF